MPSKNNNVNSIHQIARFGGFLILGIVLLTCSADAQQSMESSGQNNDQSELSRDENGKYIYYEVVEGKVFNGDSLRMRVKAFLQLKKMVGYKADEVRVQAAGKFIISKTAFVLSHPSGEVLYDFEFGIKENKYRFWLTNFVFIPYQRDRYANYVPATVKGAPLEKNVDKINSTEWKSYVDTITQQAKSFAVEFKEFLVQPGIKIKPLKKPAISLKNW
jgi:hypothetical protein